MIHNLSMVTHLVSSLAYIATNFQRTSKQNRKSKQSSSKTQILDDDVVTKYLKKFKDSISPKKNVCNISIKTVKESSKSSPVSLKGKGTGKKTKSIKQHIGGNVDAHDSNEICSISHR